MAPKIRVLHIITRLDMGGSAQNTVLSCMGLDPALYSVTLVKGSTVESNMTREEVQRLEQRLASAREQGVRVITIPTLVRRISPENDLRAFVSLFRHIRASKPDIRPHPHLQGRPPWQGCSLAGARSADRPYPSRPCLLRALRPWAVPHLSRDRENARLYNQPSRRPNPRGGRRLRRSRGDAAAQDLRRFGSTRVDRPRKRQELGFPPQALAVGFVGWLLPIKGVSFLVRAMPDILARHPESFLVLVGKGDDEPKLRSLADSLGLNGRVLFLGWRPDVEEILPCLDLRVLPSLNEGMGRVLVEAMAAGVPIVASRIGGVPDLIWDGENGLLVPPADCGALEQAISTLLADEPTRRRMAARGKGICAQYSAEGMVDQISDLYALLQNGLSPQGPSGAILAKSYP